MKNNRWIRGSGNRGVALALAFALVSGCAERRETPTVETTTLSGDVPVATDKPSLVTGRSGENASPYGICAHLIRHDHDFRDKECAAIAALGASTVRFGVSWRSMQKSPDAPLDFSKLDAIVAEAESHGLTILPILYWPPKWAQPV